MTRIRMIEEEIARRYPEGKMRCPVHLSVGQEAAAVGICSVLTPEDKMVSTHRGHAHYLAKGGSLKGLIGELYGKSTGCARGNGGSMHLIDLAAGFYGSTSIVGGTIPVGVGLAFADKLKGSSAITAICIGDAAIEEGVFHEAANFAGLHKLRVLFVCENNEYSCYTHIRQRQPKRKLYCVANAHGLYYTKTYPTLGSISMMAKNALKTLPHFIEIPAWRFLQHCGPDNDDKLGYRSNYQMLRWRKRDWYEGPDPEIQDEIRQVFEEVEADPFPDESEIGKYVYAPHNV